MRKRIKDENQELHDKLDSDPLSLKLISPQATREDYARFLARTLGFLKPIEELLQQDGVRALAAPLWTPSAPRYPRVQADLRSLGVLQSDIDSLPQIGQLPRIETAGHLMGVGYVLEGSMMGGLVMAKPVARTLELPPGSMTFFLPAQPKEIVRSFEQFAQTLDSFAKCACDACDALEAAKETFQLIDDWFRNAPPLGFAGPIQ